MPSNKLDDDMRAVIQAQRLCFAATVTPEGKPNLSPKGTIRVWDDRRLFFCDIASPGTRHNLEKNPWIDDEWKMRELWKSRRRELDERFEEHIKKRGPWLGGSNGSVGAKTGRS